MVDKEKILAGRKAIDDYKAAHTELHSSGGTSEDHTPLVNIMLSKLKGLGFDSIEDFMETNKQAVQEDAERCIKIEGECDFCVGRERACAQACYDRRLQHIPIDVGKNALSTWRLDEGFYKGLGIRKKGLTHPMIPGCSITSHIVKDAAFDWHWGR